MYWFLALAIRDLALDVTYWDLTRYPYVSYSKCIYKECKNTHMWTGSTIYQIQPLPKKTEGQQPNVEFSKHIHIFVFNKTKFIEKDHWKTISGLKVSCRL